MTEQEIRYTIKKLAKKYGTTNPFELCELMGINVEKEPLGKLDGYYHYFNRTINTLFLSMNTYMITTKYENEANLFADILTELDKDIHIC